ncbi:hypothetical protein LOCC1_G005285 [Lachnellula occidentalis]|uniref:Small secreted protein n=1 Tax=Lachnellula occidentalis TaxID=215460 RepID=A0A8H8U933_9HELO|nr:hypothetical protein LOCC1_G005285 [Lachnellula occidentalis]
MPKKEKAATTSSASTAVATAKAAKASASSTSAATGSAGAAAGASVLTASTYNDIQISGGTAGTAETEANALFSNIDQTNLAGVSAADLAVIKATHDAAEDAETDAFNPAVDAASGDAATALTNGKIKNKVLKLTAEVLGIRIDAAQGGDDSELAAEQAKLANNIKLDTAANGQASTAVPFDATT